MAQRVIPVSSVFIILLALLCEGCGYSLRTTGEPMTGHMESLAIPLVESPSSELGFEGELTKLIREEFIRHSKVPLVPEEDAAYVFIGRVTEIDTEDLSYDLTQTTLEGETATYEQTNARWLRVELDAKVVEQATGTVLWANERMRERATFPVGTDPLNNRYSQREAVRQIAERLAKKIYLKTMERF